MAISALAWTVGSSNASHWSAVAEVEILKWAVRYADRQNSFQKALRHHTFHPHCKVVRLISHVCSVAYLMCGMYWSCQELLFLKIVSWGFQNWTVNSCNMAWVSVGEGSSACQLFDGDGEYLLIQPPCHPLGLAKNFQCSNLHRRGGDGT